MTLAPPIRRGLPRSRIPAPYAQLARDTGGMALRFTVQGDDEAETVEGYQMLLSLGLIERMRPKFMTDGRWMARAVPRPEQSEPADEATAAG